MRKFISILFALVLVLSLSLVMAVPAGAQETLHVVPFTLQTGTNEASWSTEQFNTGSYSVKLNYVSGDNSYVEFTPFTGTTFGDLASITTDWSWWYYTSTANGPLLELRFTSADNVDPDGAGHIDITVNTAESAPVIDTGTVVTVSDTSTATCYGNDGNGDAFYDGSWSPGTSTGNLTLAELVTAVTTLFADPEWDGLEDPADWELTRVRAEIWGGSARTCYIDDITIDGTTYYGLIQDAIDSAAAGDTILVADGTYEESISVTTDNLTLRSENGRDFTTIQNVGNVTYPEAAQCGFLIRGPANNFTLGGAADQGFTFVGGTAPRLIQLNNGPSGVEISHNTVNTTGTASTGINIGAAGATGLTVSNNTFIADEGSITLVGPCLVDVTVTYNNFSGPWDPVENPGDIYTPAIYFSGVTASSSDSPSTISNNIITAHGRGILLENGDGTSNLLISDNNISNSYVGIKFDEGAMAGDPGDMTTVTVTQNTLSTNTTGLLIVDGVHIDASAFTITYNNFNGNTTYGLENGHSTEFVTAECNYWGHASGPSEEGPGTGDAVSVNVDYEPWLLVVGGSCYEQTQILNVGWTLVSTDSWIDSETLITPATTSWQGVTLAYKYTPSTSYEEATVADLVPVNALYLKTVGGGGIGIVYSGGVPVASSKDLEAGWNLISSATGAEPNGNGGNAGAVLSPLRYVQIGQMVGPGLATLVSQGNYNRNSVSFYLATLTDTDWTALTGTNLNPFDGYWVYMNAAKSFGVIPD